MAPLRLSIVTAEQSVLERDDVQRVVAPTKVNGSTAIVIVWAFGPSERRISTRKSSMAGYRNSSMTGRRRWISSMKRMSPGCWLVRAPTKSAGFSRTGPEVVLMLAPISRAMSDASVVLPSPGGP